MKIPGTLLPFLACLVIALTHPMNAVAADFSAIWDGGNGNWDDPLHWNTNPNYPNNGGGVTYDATIYSGGVTLDRDITIQRLTLNGYLYGSSVLTLNEGLSGNGSLGQVPGYLGFGSSISGPTINLSAGSSSNISSFDVNGTINNSGTVTQSGYTFMGQYGIINNLAGATWNMQSVDINAPIVSQPFYVPPTNGQFNNAGNLVVTVDTSSGGIGLSPGFLGTTFNNSGNVTLQTATPGGFGLLTLVRGASSGSFNLGAQTELDFRAYTLNSGATINGAGTVANLGTVNIAGDTTIGANFVNRATLIVQTGATLTLNGPFAHALPEYGYGTLAVTRLDGGTIASAQTIGFQNGMLAGRGTISANLNLSGSILQSQFGGTSVGGGINNYDSFTVKGATALGGSLGVFFKNGFENSIAASDAFTVLTSSSGFTGSFDNAANGSRMDTGDYLGTFLVSYGSTGVALSNFVPNTRWLGGSGNWTNGAKWLSNPLYPNDNGSTHYSALIRDGSVELDTNITISRFLMTGGGLTGGNTTLNITDGLAWTNGTISGPADGTGTINLAAGSISTISNPLDGTKGSPTLMGRVLNNFGTMNQTADIGGQLSGQTIVNNMAGATWNIDTTRVDSFITTTGYSNFGNMTIKGFISTYSVFNNNGTLALQDGGRLWLNGGGTGNGNFDLGAGSEFVAGDSSVSFRTYTFNAGAVVTGAGTLQVGQVNIAGNTTINSSVLNDGHITVQSGVTLTLNGAFKQGGFFASGFTTSLNGGTINSAQLLNFETGMLTGSGTINGNVSMGSNTPGMTVKATISPGASAGTLTVNGTISLLNSSKLVMEIGGLTQGTQYDYLANSGAVTLDGILELRMLNNFQMQLNPSQIFTLLTSNSLLSGAFDNVANGARLTTADGLASFQVNYGKDSLYGADNVVLSDPRAVPEPASLVLFAGGAAVLGFLRFRRG